MSRRPHKLAVVIPTIGRYDDLRRMLGSLAAQAEKFSVETFMAEFRQVVLEFFNHPVPQKVNHGQA